MESLALNVVGQLCQVNNTSGNPPCDVAKIVRTTIHRVSVGVLRIILLALHVSFWDPWDVVRLRRSSSYWNVPGKCGPHSELFLFLIRKEPVALTKAVPFQPFVSAETLVACALIGLHLLAAEYEIVASGSQSPDLGDMWRYGCPRSPDWDGNVQSWTESKGTSSHEQRERNVESLAPNVMGQDQSGEKMSLFLEDWELGRVALSCHIALDMLCQELHEAW